MEDFDNFWAKAVEIAWGLPLVVLLISAGVYFAATSRFIPFRALKHAIQILRGRFDNPHDPGEISHFQALNLFYPELGLRPRSGSLSLARISHWSAAAG